MSAGDRSLLLVGESRVYAANGHASKNVRLYLLSERGKNLKADVCADTGWLTNFQVILTLSLIASSNLHQMELPCKHFISLAIENLANEQGSSWCCTCRVTMPSLQWNCLLLHILADEYPLRSWVWFEKEITYCFCFINEDALCVGDLDPFQQNMLVRCHMFMQLLIVKNGYNLTVPKNVSSSLLISHEKFIRRCLCTVPLLNETFICSLAF